tara:strand:- start:1674 stop:2033 length:360 start_codon:yes stop_codon:yes gene_type:complete
MENLPKTKDGKLKIPYKMGIGSEGIMTEEQFKELQAKKARGDYTDVHGGSAATEPPIMTLTPEQFEKLGKLNNSRVNNKTLIKKNKARDKKLDKIRNSMTNKEKTNRPCGPPKFIANDN